MGVWVLAVTVLSGCATAESSSVTASASPPVTPKPSAGPLESALGTPAQVFGADCGAVFTLSGLSAALGTAMVTADPRPVTEFYDVAVRTGAGLSCDWAPGSGLSGASLSAVVLPAALMAAGSLEEPWCYAVGDGDAILPACSFDISRSGYWLSGIAYTAVGTTESDVRTAVSRITEQFTTSAAETSQVGSGTQPLDAWPAVPCSSLAASQPVAAVTGGFAVSGGNGPAEVPGGYIAAAQAASMSNCIWQESGSNPAGFTVQTLPGAAWVQDEVAALPGAQELAVPGLERAVVTTTGDLVTLHIFDGSNLMTVDAGGPSESADATVVGEKYGPVAVALVTAFNQYRDEK